MVSRGADRLGKLSGGAYRLCRRLGHGTFPATSNLGCPGICSRLCLKT